MSLAKIAADIVAICYYEAVASCQASTLSHIILNMISLLLLLIFLFEAINNVIFFLEVIILCSWIRAYPFANFAITFARYIVFVKDLFYALGLPKTAGFLQEALWGESPTNIESSPTLIRWESVAVANGEIMYSWLPMLWSSSSKGISGEFER